MLDDLKGLAARKIGKLLASDTTIKVLSNRQVQGAMLRAINLRAEARDLVESRLQGVAAALDLVTRDDVAGLKRTIRDLEDQVDELREELVEARDATHTPAPAGGEPRVDLPEARDAGRESGETKKTDEPAERPAKDAGKKAQTEKAQTEKAQTEKAQKKKSAPKKAGRTGDRGAPRSKAPKKKTAKKADKAGEPAPGAAGEEPRRRRTRSKKAR